MAALDLLTADEARKIVREELERVLADLRAVSAPAGGVQLTTEQAAAELGLAEKTVRRLAREGRLKGERRGTTWRFTPAAIEAYRHGDRPPTLLEDTLATLGVK